MIMRMLCMHNNMMVVVGLLRHPGVADHVDLNLPFELASDVRIDGGRLFQLLHLVNSCLLGSELHERVLYYQSPLSRHFGHREYLLQLYFVLFCCFDWLRLNTVGNTTSNYVCIG